MEERDIPDSVWNRYMKEKFSDKYIVKRDENGIWQIAGWKTSNTVEIQLYSYNKHLLTALFDYKTSKGITLLKKKLPDYCHISQEGNCDCNIVFPEDKLDELDKLGIVKIKHRKHLSDEQREILRQRVFQLQKLGKMPSKHIAEAN